MILALKRYLARRRLAQMVAERRDSFECEQFRRRRAAALKATRGLNTLSQHECEAG